MPFLPPNQQCQSTEGIKDKGLLNGCVCVCVFVLSDSVRLLLSCRYADSVGNSSEKNFSTSVMFYASDVPVGSVLGTFTPL